MRFFNQHKLGLRYKLLAVVLLIGSWQVPAIAEPQMQLGLYVVADDMSASKTFYNALFHSEPAVDFGNFVSYRIAGGLFALYAKEAFSHPFQQGNNVIPYIQVNDIEKEYERVKAISPKMVHDRVLDEGAIKLFMFTDPSGNPLEFFSIVNK